MSSPQTINGLMRHLRDDCNIQINGSYQKKQLISYGYYHGYKGYRFCKTRSTSIPYTDFSELIAVIEYDNYLKALLYPELMFLETAIKNIVCNESVKSLKSATFDHIFSSRMNDNTTDSKLQAKRLKLRNTIYSSISRQFNNEQKKDNKMVRHFYNRGEDIPLWTIFEFIMLNDLADFIGCLNINMRENILVQLNMLDSSCDTNRELLSTTLYTLKPLRNAVAHNNIIFDTRFKDRNINSALRTWLEKETGIQNITLYSLVDYIILICCILKRINFNNCRGIELIDSYNHHNNVLASKVSPQILQIIMYQNVSTKITGLKQYLNS